eukprot:1162133-Pelagomonas_calceolata.AAC.4
MAAVHWATKRRNCLPWPCCEYNTNINATKCKHAHAHTHTHTHKLTMILARGSSGLLRMGDVKGNTLKPPVLRPMVSTSSTKLSFCKGVDASRHAQVFINLTLSSSIPSSPSPPKALLAPEGL